jgi:hypothetical protein
MGIIRHRAGLLPGFGVKFNNSDQGEAEEYA